jgi:hypothetical protein
MLVFNNSKIIAFLSNSLTLRGTEVVLYDYAYYNEKILGNKSIIITRDFNTINNIDANLDVYNKFKKRFQIEYYKNDNPTNEIDDFIEKNNISYLYIIKSGEYDQLLSTKCKNLIHCVFSTQQPHGDIYSVVGQTINDINKTNYPVVPHIVNLPKIDNNLKLELNIPIDAIVFGRYGGKDSFDIKFVHNVIKKLLDLYNNIYFIFMNTNIFYEHKNIIYLPGNCDLIYKRKFINTCDALLHARFRGETFGLTCGEFAICEKPVITWGNSSEKEHLNILKNHAIIYYNYFDLFNILSTFYKNKYDMKNNGYMFYTPENVMEIFKKIYLDN